MALLRIETVRSNQFELLFALVHRHENERSPEREPADVRSALGDMLRDPLIARFWLAFDGREPIGYAVMTLGSSLDSHGRHAVLDRLYVLPAYRNDETCERMLWHIESAARGMRFGCLYYTPPAAGVVPADFFASRGFTRLPRATLRKPLRDPEPLPAPPESNQETLPGV